MVEDVSASTIPLGKILSDDFCVNNDENTASSIVFDRHIASSQPLAADVATTLFKCYDESERHCLEKLLENNLLFGDLASLTSRDLEILGFAEEEFRSELLMHFRYLPHQNSTYYNICNTKNAQVFNSHIFGNASSYLVAMYCSLKIAKYKLQLYAPVDVIIGEKSFANCFALKALTELKIVAQQVEEHLKLLEQMIPDDEDVTNSSVVNKTKQWFWLTPSLLSGAIALIWYWKYKKMVL